MKYIRSIIRDSRPAYSEKSQVSPGGQTNQFGAMESNISSPSAYNHSPGHISSATETINTDMGGPAIGITDKLPSREKTIAHAENAGGQVDSGLIENSSHKAGIENGNTNSGVVINNQPLHVPAPATQSDPNLIVHDVVIDKTGPDKASKMAMTGDVNVIHEQEKSHSQLNDTINHTVVENGPASEGQEITVDNDEYLGISKHRDHGSEKSHENPSQANTSPNRDAGVYEPQQQQETLSDLLSTKNLQSRDGQAQGEMLNQKNEVPAQSSHSNHKALNSKYEQKIPENQTTVNTEVVDKFVKAQQEISKVNQYKEKHNQDLVSNQSISKRVDPSLVQSTSVSATKIGLKTSSAIRQAENPTDPPLVKRAVTKKQNREPVHSLPMPKTMANTEKSPHEVRIGQIDVFIDSGNTSREVGKRQAGPKVSSESRNYLRRL